MSIQLDHLGSRISDTEPQILNKNSGVNMPILFCNIGWMNRYQGLSGTGERIMGGGSFVDQNEHGHEVCNFLICGNHVYGHVESIKGEVDLQIKIERLGANTADLHIDGVDVVWTATDPAVGGRRVIGWYRHATVYRYRQHFENPPSTQHARDEITSYRIVAKAQNAILLEPEERDLVVPHGEGWMGERQWWYADIDRKDVKNFVETVLELIREGAPLLQSPAEEIVQPNIYEGAKKTISVNVYERDPHARRLCISHHGASCSVCGFDFGKVYGEIGNGFIHVHHLKPLSEIKRKYKVDPISDLRPVCPNCHAMIHRDKENMMTIQELQKLIKRR